MKASIPFNEILDKLRQRDTSVLVVLLEQYSGRLAGYAQRHWQFTTDEASELIYETFDVLLRRAGQLSFEAQAPFDSFVFGVFINKLREAHRKRSREARYYVPLDQLEADDGETDSSRATADRAELPNEWFSVTDESDEHELIRQMEAALATLPDIDRTLLLLWAQGYSYPEIAAQTGLDPVHLNVRCFRVKQRVINWFSEHKKHLQL